MKYQRKVRTVDAMQLQHPITLKTPNGTVHGKAGDWLVTEGDQQKIVEDGAFQDEWQQSSDWTYFPYIGWNPQPIPMWLYPTITYVTNTTSSSGPLCIDAVPRKP